jgi:hypothetical protein
MNRLAGTLLLTALLVCGADWTDRSEYDLALAVRAEAAPKKRIELLDAWRAKYPKSDLRQVRRELYLAAYQSLGDNGGMLGVAREMLADQPMNPVGLYWCTLLVPNVKDAPADLLAAGETAAKNLLRVSGAPPASAPLARRTLAWIAWQRGDYAGAQEQLTAWLKLNPREAEASAWFGTVLGLEKKSGYEVPMLWHLARAASLRGDGALPERRQRQVEALLDKLYISYHGEPEGLEQIRTTAAAAETPALPPAGFQIESAAQLAIRRMDEELERTNPQLLAWVRIRRNLEGPNAAAYWETLRSAPLPKLKGTLIAFSPARRPTELTLGMRDAATPELVLKLSAPLAREPDTGIVVEFDGASAQSYTATPFQVVVSVDTAKLEGLPESVRPK